MNRRDLLRSTLLSAAVLALRPARSPAADVHDAVVQLAALERKHGGRLGVAILDTGRGRRVAHRGDERFLMCSTFKLLLVAAVLTHVDRGEGDLDRRIVFGKEAVLDYAPVTRQHVGPPGMSVAALCEAAITLSDNTAANLLLGSVGGPAAVTRYAGGLGDTITRLDRTEPTLNRPDGERDTTTPSAMLDDMHELLLHDALSASSRQQLTNWLLACQTGVDSLHTGLPADWREGDKTGQGTTANNDIAILWPPRRQPLLVTAYYENAAADIAVRKAVLAATGQIVARL